MTCRFSKSPLTDRTTFVWATLLALVLSFAATSCPLLAQEPIQGKEGKTFIRFWNMLPDKPGNDLQVFAGERPLFGAAPFDLVNDYIPAPAGSYSLAIKRATEQAELLQKFPVILQENAYTTLLATEKNGQPVIEIFNDTPDPKVAELTARLVVRSFFSGGRVAVGVAGGQPPQPIANGMTAIIDNLRLAAGVNITVQVSQSTVPPPSKTWTLPADFSVTHRATLLLVPDHYGRLQPKLIYDGRLAYPNVPAQSGRH